MPLKREAILSAMQSLRDLQDYYLAASEDTEEARRQLNDKPASQFCRRTLVRCFAAQVEGVLYRIRQVTLMSREAFDSQLSFGELVLLKEKTYQLDERGKMEERGQFLDKIPRVFRFTLDCYSKVFGSSFRWDAADTGYECFQKLVSVRNRLMHPKGKDELMVTDDELSVIRKAWDWYPKQIQGVLDSSMRAFSETVAAMEKAKKPVGAVV